MGFPDWQRGVQWQGPEYLSLQKVTLDATGTYTLVSAKPNHSYRGVMVTLLGALNSAWLRVQSYTGEPTLFHYDRVEQYLTTDCNFTAAFDVHFDNVTVEIFGGTAGDTFTAAVWPTNLDPGFYVVDSFGPLLYQWPTVTMASLAHETYDLVPYYGEAVIVAEAPAGSSLSIQVAQYDEGGAQISQSYRKRMAGLSDISETLWLPPGRNRLTVENVGAGSTNAYISVVGKYNLVRGI